MSGLVSGLQNRVRRFESARNLTLLKKLIATVPWMSGLVSGLQNRVRRFESARNLNNNALLAQLVEQLTLNQWVQGSNP